MKPAVRHKKLLAKLRESNMLSVEELAEAFDTSRETIRRDITFLAANNRLRKVHGGAVSMPSGFEQRFQERAGAMREEKLAACRKALALVRPGESLFIDNGTTTLIFAELLLDVRDLTVLTNSLRIVNLLSSRHKVFLLGGWVDADASATIGPGAILQAGQFNTDHAFLSIGGITLDHGFCDFTEPDAAIALAMLKNAAKTTIITDHSKFWKNALVRMCALEEIDCLATDAPVPEEFLPRFKTGNVRIL
ncbi:MAG: DeoR/GlpR family DNA-binding transcription regulator [Methylobacteriaceae bacterium]|jgi:DeoR family glycerol-3-phosphate regulon repressor|nr:DeoR/GlpR family DNA-binding transcription regulator [Methylobacteriaceae bacterium]